jgi:hypothetical protein
MEGYSPLEVAARHNHEFLCEKISELMDPFPEFDPQRYSAAREASGMGHLPSLKKIIANDPAKIHRPSYNRVLTDSTDEDGLTCLHLAAANGNDFYPHALSLERILLRTSLISIIVLMWP